MCCDKNSNKLKQKELICENIRLRSQITWLSIQIFICCEMNQMFFNIVPDKKIIILLQILIIAVDTDRQNKNKKKNPQKTAKTFTPKVFV